jgi:hypothetical protein
VEILFGHGALERRCRTQANRELAWGASGSAVGRRLFELFAVASVADAALLPGVLLQPDGSAGRYRMRSVDGVEIILRPMLAEGHEPAVADDLTSLGTVVIEKISLIAEQGGE